MLGNQITVIGGAVYDIMFYADNVLFIDNRQDLLRQKLAAFEYGAKIYSDKVYLVNGGSGANVAVSLANFGLKTQLLCRLGHDFLGQDILANLKKKKVSTKIMQFDHKHQTGLSFVANVGKDNEHVIFAYRGANDYLELNVDKINTPFVYLTSLPKNYTKQMDHLFNKVAKKKIKLAWNPGTYQLQLPASKLKEYLSKTHVLIVNRDEALEILAKHKVKNNIKDLLKHLHKFGQKITVITDGAKGSYAFDGEQVFFQAVKKVKTLNTTGAGDSFGSGFLAGLIKYKNIKKALALGTYNSAAVVSKIGAQVGLLHASDLKKYKI